MKRRSSVAGPGAAGEKLRMQVRCMHCGAAGEIEYCHGGFIDALVGVHTAECQRKHGLSGFVRKCATPGCGGIAQAGKNECAECVKRGKDKRG